MATNRREKYPKYDVNIHEEKWKFPICDYCTSAKQGCNFLKGHNECQMCLNRHRPCRLNGRDFIIWLVANGHRAGPGPAGASLCIAQNAIRPAPNQGGVLGFRQNWAGLASNLDGIDLGTTTKAGPSTPRTKIGPKTTTRHSPSEKNSSDNSESINKHKDGSCNNEVEYSKGFSDEFAGPLGDNMYPGFGENFGEDINDLPGEEIDEEHIYLPPSDLELNASDEEDCSQTPLVGEVPIHPMYLARELEREPDFYSTAYPIGDGKNDVINMVEHRKAYSSFHSDDGTPIFPFTHQAINEAQRKTDLSYLPNHVYPFEPAESTYMLAWVNEQAKKHGFAFNSISYHWKNCWWTFASGRIPRPPMPLPVENRPGQLMLCCEQARNGDFKRNFSIYHATLDNLAKHTIAKQPQSIIRGSRYQNGEDIYTKYTYFFNTLTHGDDGPILRRFACNNISGENAFNDAVELILGDHPTMVLECKVDTEQVEGTDFLVRLPAVKFYCPNHVHYSPILIHWVRYHPAYDVVSNSINNMEFNADEIELLDRARKLQSVTELLRKDLGQGFAWRDRRMIERDFALFRIFCVIFLLLFLCIKGKGRYMDCFLLGGFMEVRYPGSL